MANPRDPYTVLGVPKTADAAALKKAFRDLAKKYHPDKTKGDKAAEVKFKEINGAYDLLGDPTKRAKYDRGELDGAGNERGFAGGGGARPGGAGGFNPRDYNFTSGSQSAGGGFDDAGDIFSEFFGGGNKRGRASAGFGGGAGFQQALAGEDVRYELAITLAEAVRGGKRRIQLATGKTIDVAIPPGTNDGDTLRLKGQGAPSRGGGPNGAALVELKIEPHAYFTLKGRDIMARRADHTAGSRARRRNPRADAGRQRDGQGAQGQQHGAPTLRLKGKGALPVRAGGESGDQYLTLKIVLPEKQDAALAELVEDWASKHSYNPRKF